MTGGSLLPYIRSSAQRQLNGYLPRNNLRNAPDRYITAPGLGERSGINGAILLAMTAP